ncbi:hypothetical protein TL16_g10173 [Triparma laevis f. inornata]|uniref:Methyltransferase type 11 domain-containing protein n=1 Tax=Triparma laevis f. inornata TaxID=1714386 RepID=A0A9W7BFK3_9STRA|nr:hypothetical protein TL16_g10173 [Triparma laevis f. inornata]
MSSLASTTDTNHPSSSHPPLPSSNSAYSRLDYWNERFTSEKQFEWLLNYSDLKSYISHACTRAGLNKTTTSVLLVGCGNSTLSPDMYSDGYQNVISLDYSTSCIESMKLQFPETDNFKWVLGDMTNLVDFKAAQFDLVIDKAAMDAIMVEEGDVWNPDTNVIDMARKMCREISRVLRVGGMHLQVSFAQPHFRRKYLEGGHGGEGGVDSSGVYNEFGWDLTDEPVAGDNKDGCFHHFFYSMHKKRDGKW